MLIVEDKVGLLKKVEIFSDIPENILIEIAAALKEISVFAGQTIITKGEQGDCMYIIFSGSVRVHEGEHTIVEIQEKKIFGELTLLNSEPRTASVSAIEAGLLLRLDQEDFYRIAAERSEVSRGIIKLLITRLKTQNNSIIDSLKAREAELVILVEERTIDLREEKIKVEMAYEEISAQNENLEEAYIENNKQKEELQEKNKHIASSIQYAKRIQDAILPSIDNILNGFPDSFLIFKPRDVVSGDCYFYKKDGHKYWIAAIDCTGHGVPGAFMSIIANTLLNQIVGPQAAKSPAEVLKYLHIGVRRALKQDEAESKNRDGMDIALCLIDKYNKTIRYSAANRPLYIIDPETGLNEIKADKHCIGGLQIEEERLFTDHTIQYNEGQFLYLFSDGYVDQFGGPNNKKFMTRNFKELLVKISDKTIFEQGEIINENFENWKHGYSQIDDVLVIGIKL